MYSLVYRSVAEPFVDTRIIREILETARNFNKKNDITGCLLFYHGEFIQYLEGRQTTVLKLFDSIKADKRHRNVQLLSYATIKEREFADWSMAYEDFLGDNDQLQFIKLLLSSYVENPKNAMDPNPSSVFFWRAARRLLKSKSSREY